MKGTTIPTYGTPLIVALAEPVRCALVGGVGWIPPGRYRARTHYGRTERALTAGGPVFGEVYLEGLDEGTGTYRLSLAALRDLLGGDQAAAPS